MTTLTREKIKALREAARAANADTDYIPPVLMRCDPATILSLCDMAEAVPTITYSRIIAIVDDCVERMQRSEESHRMLAKWISEGINAAIRSTLEAGQTDRVGELVATLRWYEAQARGCRKITSEGDVARNALAADGGNRAHSALSKAQEDGE